MISQSVLVNARANDIISEPEKGAPADMAVGAVPPCIGQDAGDQGIVRPDVSKDSEKVKEEQAATKVQAAFRGYLVTFDWSYDNVHLVWLFLIFLSHTSSILHFGQANALVFAHYFSNVLVNIFFTL